MNERKAGLKAKLEAELAAAADESELGALRDRFSAEERALEHAVDHEVHTFSATVDVACAARHHTRNAPPRLNHPCVHRTDTIFWPSERPAASSFGES